MKFNFEQLRKLISVYSENFFFIFFC
ncbi:hypothetical protein DERP_011210 [Dermatophagoides pteronyssinus]|uniref:Uncharacterized protein n=1 Tax=Dermatophagoides pteronyssinus TaxID=6956 RepID=A0ABQ8JCF1_DERPT|nr:hypothetical protein DERP_011210 [Dermatophagoides pteronyssinus]